MSLVGIKNHPHSVEGSHLVADEAVSSFPIPWWIKIHSKTKLA